MLESPGSSHESVTRSKPVVAANPDGLAGAEITWACTGGLPFQISSPPAAANTTAARSNVSGPDTALTESGDSRGLLI